MRPCFRDWAAEETDHPREVIEAALAHVVQNRVEAAYRRTDLFERRRRLMGDWAAYLAGAPREPDATTPRGNAAELRREAWPVIGGASDGHGLRQNAHDDCARGPAARAGWVKRALFLADRVSLVNQAIAAFKAHLPESSPVNLVTEKDKAGRVYVSTYPTMMGLIDETYGNEARFSVGHFDLVIIDEAHRSVYEKYGAIFRYFDSLLVGLTATPSDHIDRNTYTLFDLEPGVPTDAYELETAVADGFLVPPRVQQVDLKFPREGIDYDSLSEEEQEQWESLDWGDDVDENGLPDKVNHHYPHYKGHFARIIDHYAKYPQSLLDDFSQKNKPPHIAISVDMLDTGIDVPEVANLVFFKPVYSKIKFWQMIGRGTRPRSRIPRPRCCLGDERIIHCPRTHSGNSPRAGRHAPVGV